jgi:tight adherence protein B
MTPILPAVFIFLAAALATFALAFLWEAIRGWRSRRNLAGRLEALDADLSSGAAGSVGTLLKSEAALPRLFESAAARFPQLRDLALTIEQADLGWSVQTFLFLTIGLGIGAGAAALLSTRKFVLAAAFAVIGAFLPYFYVSRKRKKRFRAFEEKLPEAIDLIGRALRAGHPFSSGIKMVADEIPYPVGIEFRRVYEEHRFGVTVPDALLSLADRVHLIDLRMFVTSVLIQREVGGNLAEILEKIAYTIRERFKIRRQVRVHTAQGRMTGYLLAALPILTGMALLAINPDYIKLLFRDPVGHMILGTIAVLQVLGFLVIRKIVDIEY